MTTLIPRQFYSQEELDKLYPKELELQLVQIVSTNAIASLCTTANYNTSYCAMVSILDMFST
jgi:acid phosphatase